jgi:uncharacterized protein
MLSMGRRLAIALSVAILSFVVIFSFLSSSGIGLEDLVPKTLFGTQSESLAPQNFSNGAEIFVPAVDSEGNGKITKFTVEAVPGDGKTLANIDHLLFFADTQFSIQTAKDVAANVTGIDPSRYDLIYDIETEDNRNAAVEGPSAGAAITIATIAALEGKELSPDVMITGTINPDGTIGRIGGVQEKAEVARESGAKVFLVPSGQGLEDSSRVETDCERVGRMKICRTNYVPEPSLSMDGNGLIIKEVSNIQEAVGYFISD